MVCLLIIPSKCKASIALILEFGLREENFALLQVLKTETRAEEAESSHRNTKSELQETQKRMKTLHKQIEDLTDSNERLRKEADEARRDALNADHMSDSSSDAGDQRMSHPHLSRLKLPGDLHMTQLT